MRKKRGKRERYSIDPTKGWNGEIVPLSHTTCVPYETNQREKNISHQMRTRERFDFINTFLFGISYSDGNNLQNTRREG
jgi:hypothetical protein